MTRRDLIRALITGAGHLGCPMNGNHAYGDAAGLKHAMKWAEARTLNQPNDHATAAWLRHARAATILYKIV